MAANDFAVMTAGQIWSEDVITDFVIATDTGDETTANAHVQKSFPIDSLRMNGDSRFLDLLQWKRGLVFKFSFSRKFYDKFCRGDVRCLVPSIIVKNGVNENEI